MDYALARHNMVESQVKTNKVTDERLLAAMAELPRERFVAEEQRGVAYVDEDIPVGRGRFLMEPMVLARLLQAAEPEADDLALDIGCGTGYSTAVLARLCGTVVALESDPGLAGQATALLADLVIDNAAVVEGGLGDGYAKQAPYDVILLGGAVAEIPQAITSQLAEGGRMVAVVADARGMGKATLYTHTGTAVSSRVLFDAAVPHLPGFEKLQSFEF
ncbi:MAG: protein-L-isoaspartate O-methyltransferase [Alphaproteobacteria bacterium]|nr:protein-L-isoaspartate O-methyltransferase [Alphaproteobacteria bacterium]